MGCSPAAAYPVWWWSHTLTDAITNMFPALLPVLQARFGLSEAALAALVTTLTLSNSVTQPWFGTLADRVGRRKVVALGGSANAALLSLIGTVPNVYRLLGLLLVGGLSSAAMHPGGASLAGEAGGRRRALALFSFAAALGGITAGVLSHRLLAQWLVPGGMLLALLPLLGSVALKPDGAAFFTLVALGGALVQSGRLILIVRAQASSPHHVAASSGMMMGFATGLAGLLDLGLGAVQQFCGLTPALVLGDLSLIPGAALAFWALREHDASGSAPKVIRNSINQTRVCASCPA